MKIAVKSQGAKIDLRHGIVGKVWEKEKEVMGTGRGDRERRALILCNLLPWLEFHPVVRRTRDSFWALV